MEASPVLQAEDTLSIKGEFYKNGTNLYYSNEKEEMYMEDSFLIQVNHIKKSIWISKVDVASKENMNLLPLNKKEMEDLFRKKYVISKTTLSSATEELNFAATQFFDSISMVVVNIALDYSGKTFLPALLKMNVKMKQVLEEEQVAQLKNEGKNAAKALEKIGDRDYLVRNQGVTVSFIDIDNSKEKAMQIPQWQEKINYDKETNEFKGKGTYSDYEIVKTF
jgi:hypothetical protein